MSAETSTRSRKLSRAEWTLLSLLIASIFINYIDRGNLSIAVPLIEKELALSPVQIGALLSSFWTYALLQLFGVAGWVADRFPVTQVFTAAFLLWSGATIVTGFVNGFRAIYIARLFLAPANRSRIRAIREFLPVRSRRSIEDGQTRCSMRAQNSGQP